MSELSAGTSRAAQRASGPQPNRAFASSEGSHGESGTAERDWEGPVRRIADRLRATVTQELQSGDRAQFVEEVAALERRALEAEETLLRERAASAARLLETDAKFKKLEPFLKRLRAEFQEAGRERDRLRERLSQAEQRAAAAASESGSLRVLEAEREAAHREAEAAATARDAAIAEATSLRTRLENDLRNVQESWRQRIEAAESSRDKALADIKGLRAQLVNQRRAEDEIKRLVKERESLETTVSVHKAVARASQEEAQTAGQRAADAAKAAAAAVAESAEREARVADLDRMLAAARADVAAAREREAERDAKAESAGRELAEARTESVRLRRAVDDSDALLAAARAEIATLRRAVDELRAEAAAAREELTRHGADSNSERARRAEEFEALRLEAEEARARADAATRDAAEARRALDQAKDAAANESREIEDAGARLRDAESKIEQLHGELSDVRRTAEAAQAAAAAGDTERAGLARSLEEERADAVRRFEAAEASWRSQMRAAEGRFEADMHRQRQKFALSEASLAAAETRHAEDLAARDAATARLRSTAEITLRRMGRELQDLAAHISSAPAAAATMEIDEQRPPATAELAPGDIPGVTPPAAKSPDLAAPDWDRVLSDVEALSSDVRSLREPGVSDDTASIGADERAANAAAAEASGQGPALPEKEDTGTASAEPPHAAVAAHADAAPDGADDQGSRDASQGGRRRRRR